MMHLAGWYESLDPAGTETNIEALLDDRIWVENDNIRVPPLEYMIGLGGFVTGVATARRRASVYSPTLNILGRQELAQLQLFVTSPQASEDRVQWNDYSTQPIMLGYDETMRAFVDANPASAEPQAVFIQFGDNRQMAIPAGMQLALRGEFTAPTASGAWVAVNPTWRTEMPPGLYGVTGLQCIAGNTMACRLNFRTQQQWRPGVLAQRTAGVLPADYQQPGKMGVWGEFTYTQPPTLEVVQTSGSAGYVVMNVVQLRATT